MMQGEVILLAMTFGAFVALIVSWPFWIWRMDRLEKRPIEWVNQAFDRSGQDEND